MNEAQLINVLQKDKSRLGEQVKSTQDNFNSLQCELEIAVGTNRLQHDEIEVLKS